MNKKLIKTIYDAVKALLFNKHNVLLQENNPELNMIMCSFDGAELCELVHLYLLELLTKEFNK